MALMAPVLAAQGSVVGRVVVLETKGKSADDVATAVVWLTSNGLRTRPVESAQIITQKREFRPRVLVVTQGTTVTFPNLDPFNHNIFSTEPKFDLGLYGRGEGPTQAFSQPGLVRIFCNIHPRMSGFIHVLDTPYSTQPSPDGVFAIGNVPAGSYAIHVWHERAAEELRREVTVSARGLSDLMLELDASRYKRRQHRNKYGKPYGRSRERY
jgi:plastocyanin